MTTYDATRSTGGEVPEAEARPSRSGDAESMLELRQELAELARTLPGDLRRLRVRGGEREIEVEWADPVGLLEAVVDRRRTPAGETAQLVNAVLPEVVEEAFTAVRAPLVGCYYSAPSPGAEPFVQVGDTVEAGTTVAIIEAMKLMNPIVSGESGVVAEVLVTNGDSVEYDQVLLRLLPKEQAA